MCSSPTTCSISSPLPPPPKTEVLSLAGAWQVCLAGPSAEDTPPAEPAFGDAITLPATTETAGLGPLNPDHRPDRLTAVRRIEGPVWYQRDIVIPAGWAGRPVALFIERTKWCRVWLDGRLVADEPILCAPHLTPLGTLVPGPHRLTLLVDNRRRPAPGDNHQSSEHTQGNWNGLLGAIELRAPVALWMERITVVPDLASRSFGLTIRIGRIPGTAINGTIRVATGQTAVVTEPAAETVSLRLPLGPEAALWDEFSPVLHRLTITLESPHGTDERTVTTGLREFRRAGSQLNAVLSPALLPGASPGDSTRSLHSPAAAGLAGQRPNFIGETPQLAAGNVSAFTVNGRPVFLRGEVNCCVFPLTGHPPMDPAGWHDYFTTLRAHGLNHVRFHSWTPPDAAFTAADELGFYVLTELPFWGEWTPDIAAALAPEAEAILRTYGHHPSFVLLSLGNEHRGDRASRASLVAHLRQIDPHRLYAQGANNDLAAPVLAPGDDCWITARLPAPGSPGRYVNVRGSHATPDRADGHIQTGAGGTRTDYRSALAGLDLPVVSHEIGQYSSYPRFSEIARYTGVFAAHNLARLRDRAAASGLLERADIFARDSVALAAACYREEIEAALRTPGLGGFQLLGLQDFPGQGTALVGLLDAFLTSKDALTPEAFRAFCGPQVLLARFDRHTWTSGETFTADLELAHYGPTECATGEVRWTLGAVGRSSAGEFQARTNPTHPVASRHPSPEGIQTCVIGNPLLERGARPGGVCRFGIGESEISELARGALATARVPCGGLRSLGCLQLILPTLTHATRLEFSLRHEPSGAATSYPLWLYPVRPSPPVVPAGVSLVTAFNDRTHSLLAAGHTVVLCADSIHPFIRSPGGGWAPDFWSWSMFRNVPGTQGLAINAGHPALAGFPSERHSNWQWFHLARAAQPVVLDELDRQLVPIVEVIDNPERAHRLGLIFEARVGPGRLLVCAIDLPALASRQPAARALLESLLLYAAAAPAMPIVSLDEVILARSLAT